MSILKFFEKVSSAANVPEDEGSDDEFEASVPTASGKNNLKI